MVSSLLLLFGFSHMAKGNLLMDPDGLNVSLISDGSLSNQFGPDSFTQGYDPGGLFGNTLPAPMIDGSEMLVSFFESSIMFEQGTVASDLGTTLGWDMEIADIDWPSSTEIVAAYVMFDTYPIDLSVSFTADSLTIRYNGGESIAIGDLWEATVVFESQQVSAPSSLVMLLISLVLVFKRFRSH
jgi:hypothetical protein